MYIIGFLSCLCGIMRMADQYIHLLSYLLFIPRYCKYLAQLQVTLGCHEIITLLNN